MAALVVPRASRSPVGVSRFTILSARSRSDRASKDGGASDRPSFGGLGHRRLVHRRRAAAPAPARGQLSSFTELRVGDYVVHEDHGIARFTGFETQTVADITRARLQAVADQLGGGLEVLLESPDIR